MREHRCVEGYRCSMSQLESKKNYYCECDECNNSSFPSVSKVFWWCQLEAHRKLNRPHNSYTKEVEEHRCIVGYECDSYSSFYYGGK